MDHPKAKREFYGQWAKSEDENVYVYNKQRNQVTEAPNNLLYVIGADVGWNDSKTAVVLGFNPDTTDKIYIIEKFKQAQMLTSDFGQVLRDLTIKYNPIKCVIDPAAGGKDIAMEYNQRYNLYFESATKSNKEQYIELLNTDLLTGKILNVVKDGEQCELVKEIEQLQWKQQANGKRIEDPSVHNDLCDAFLYSWRQVYAYTHTEAPPQPTTVEEYNDNMARQMEQQVIEQMQQQLMEHQDEFDSWWSEGPNHVLQG